MRILIVNDDGVKSHALPHLIRWASEIGEVTCVVPDEEQSGKSQGIDFRKPIVIKQVEIEEGITVYTMNSTPADCVRFATAGLDKNYDLVLSGVNIGYNIGDDIAYSGTVGAIFEAARLGINALALSNGPKSPPVPNKDLTRAYNFVIENKLFSYNPLYNINFPENPKGICITRQGGAVFDDGYKYDKDDTYIQVGKLVEYETLDREIDIHAVYDGYISISPLTHQKTAFNAFERLKAITK